MTRRESLFSFRGRIRFWIDYRPAKIVALRIGRLDLLTWWRA